MEEISYNVSKKKLQISIPLSLLNHLADTGDFVVKDAIKLAGYIGENIVDSIPDHGGLKAQLLDLIEQACTDGNEFIDIRDE